MAGIALAVIAQVTFLQNVVTVHVMEMRLLRHVQKIAQNQDVVLMRFLTAMDLVSAGLLHG
tara:strand:- start:122 stop:304 length:183 start_codon:yes stop_codon:yes gene_type:complete